MSSEFSRRKFLSTLALGPFVAKNISGLTRGMSERGKKRPNILWLAVEDISPFLSCYGYQENPTPHLDNLARTGVMFTNTFMPSPVCSPCRSAMITGMMSTTTGTHNHYSSRTKDTAIYLPDHIKTLPEIFRDAGYFTFNQGKDDYNFWYDRKDLYAGEYTTHRLYGKSGDRKTGWRDRRKGQPFFGQIQLYGGKEIYSGKFKERVRNPIDRKKVTLPPYYPDTPEIREDWAQHLDSIRLTDDRVGKILDILKMDGELENTIIMFFSDHGMRLWRHKQFCYDSSLRVPFIMNWAGNPNGLGGAGTIRDDLVNGLDIAATSLALAGIRVPGYMESRDLFAENFQPRTHVISTRDRCDFTIDRIRSVRTERYRYIRNFYPDRPYMQPNYRDEWDISRMMRKLHADGKLNKIQDRFWSDERPAEELYNLRTDPHEIHNLAPEPRLKPVLEAHRKILTRWICETGDRGQYPEDAPNLKYMYDHWGKKCVNPEYNRFK